MNTHEIDIKLQVSKLFFWLLTSVTAGTLFILEWINCGGGLKIIFFILSLGYIGCIYWQHVLLRHFKSIISIKINHNECIFSDRNGSFPVRILGESTVTRLVSIIRFRRQDFKAIHTLVLFKDSATLVEYRRLLVKLRTMKLHGISGQNALPSAAL